MLRLGLGRLRAATPQQACRRAASSGSALPLLYRDVLIFDDSWTGEAWAAAMQPAATGNATAVNLKHPSSQHAVAKYSDWMFNHSQYHFNSVGEFSLNISAGHFYSPPESVVGGQTTSTTTTNHSVLFWPDRILLRGLSDAHIPAVAKAALDTSGPLSLAAAVRATAETCVAQFPEVVVVSACSGSPGFSLHRAQQSLDWFGAAAAEAGKPAPALVLADDLRNHRNGTNVLVLPRGGSSSEDAFELQLSLSKDKIRRLVENLRY